MEEFLSFFFFFFFLIFTHELVQFDLCSDHNSKEQFFFFFFFFFSPDFFGCHVHIECHNFLKISAKKTKIRQTVHMWRLNCVNMAIVFFYFF